MHRHLAVVLGALVLCACTGVIGNGKPGQESRELASFTRVATSAGIGVEITAGADFKVVVEADCNLLPLVKTEVTGDELRIGIDQGAVVWPQRPMLVTISMPSLAGLTASGSSKAYAIAVDAQELTVNASSSSEATLSGKAQKVTADASGSSRVALQDLAFGSAKLTVSGGSKLQAIGADSLDVNVSTSGGSEATLAGTSQSLVADASGGSRLFLQDLVAEGAQLGASGGSQIRADVTGLAQVNASGGSTVTLGGGGVIEKTVSGGSSVTAD